MTHLLFEIACNPHIPLETRYQIARYLQEQRKQQRKKEKNQRDNVRRQLKQVHKERVKGA
jgi:hypothetical protein